MRAENDKDVEGRNMSNTRYGKKEYMNVALLNCELFTVFQFDLSNTFFFQLFFNFSVLCLLFYINLKHKSMKSEHKTELVERPNQLTNE